VGAAAFMGFLHFVARWDWLSIYLRWMWWIIIAGAALHSFFEMRKPGAKRDRQKIWMAAINPVIALGLFAYAALAFVHPAATDLRFPLEGGRFVVGQGGTNPALNYHTTNKSQRYALDIGGIDALGRRAEGVLPARLSAYRVYNARVISPCDGEVISVKDGVTDNAIGETNREAAAGNHVVIACEGLEILLAHLRMGTLSVGPEDAVAAGDSVGLAGNSGNSSEPHLHIHAVRAGTGGVMEGEGAPITFGGAFLVRGSVVG
jgi:hypothetical protein